MMSHEVLVLEMLQVFYYSTLLFISSGLTEESAKFATIGIGAIMVGMTLVSIPLMDRTGRRTLHLYGLGGMFIFSIFITISFLIKVCNVAHTLHVLFHGRSARVVVCVGV
jgi:MFS family permease